MAEKLPDAGKGVSLSFASQAAKHRQKRVKVNEDENKPVHEYVTGFSENGLTFRDKDRATTSVNGKAQKVIPNSGNDLRGLGPKAYNQNRFLPQKDDVQKPEDGADRFEVAEPEARVEVKYGLTTFNRANTAAGRENGAASSSAAENDSRASKRGRKVVGTGEDWETDAYKKDVDNLPDQASLEEYEAMPVEAFGAAMLRGMGWSEEQDNGSQAQAKEFVRRAPLLGLGATAAPSAHKEKRFIKPGESREPKKEMVVYDSEGNLKHTRTADEKLVERAVLGPAVGKTMRIINGRHSGLLCRVEVIQQEVPGHSQKAEVRLRPSEEMVTVRLKDLGEKDELSKAAKAVKPNGKHRQQSRPEPDNAALDDRREEGFVGREQSRAEQPWLAPHIRIKVIDKHLRKGRLYLKKGEVTDVITPTSCTVSLDTGEQVDAEQRQLETVIPKKEGSRVLVILGPLRGKRAKLLKRNSDTSRAAIQLTEDFSVHTVTFDEISEFVGDLGEEE